LGVVVVLLLEGIWTFFDNEVDNVTEVFRGKML